MRAGEFGGFHGPGPFFGRLLISLIFILAGLFKVFNFEGSISNFHSLGFPYPALFVSVAIFFELIGGILLLIGWQVRFAAVFLIIFLVPATLIGHQFWNLSGKEMQEQFGNFFKNLTILGGLLLVLSYGPGTWSVDGYTFRKYRDK